MQRDLDSHYTPLAWIREMTPLVLKLAVVLTALLYAESAILHLL